MERRYAHAFDLRVQVCWQRCWLSQVLACADGADWSVRVTPYDQVYPALEMSRARRGGARAAQNTLGAGSGLVAVSVRARHDGERVRVDITAPGLQAPASLEATLAHAGQDYELRPPLLWDAAP